MNTNTENTNSERKTWLVRIPTVDEDTLMTPEEMKRFFVNLAALDDFSHFAVDGLIFALKTLGEWANQNQQAAIDTADEIVNELFKESMFYSYSFDKYESNIHNRFRSTNYRDLSHSDLSKAMEAEIIPDETKPLDLSGSAIESLSQKLSDILTDPILPDKFRTCLEVEIGDKSAVDVADPQTIKQALKNSLKEEQNG